MLRRSTNLIRQYSRLGARLYATEAQPKSTSTDSSKVYLRDDLKKYLKPDVLKVIESKTDSVLIKKLNFLGRNFVCRLNIAPPLILNNLSQDNVFRLLVQDLQDPWTYYWQKIQKNGSDPQKWLESLKEVKHLPYVIDRCFLEMTLSGVYPTADHFNVFLSAMAHNADNRNFHNIFDELVRVNQGAKATAESWNAMGLLWARQGDYYLANITRDYIQSKNWTLDPELDSLLQKLKSVHDDEAGYQYSTGRGPKPQFLKDRDTQTKERQDKIINTLDEGIQPPLEKLKAVEEQ